MFKNLLGCAFILLLIVFSTPGPAAAIPLMLNNVPTTDITETDTLILMLNNYSFDYKQGPGFSTCSPVCSLQYGYKKCEFGFDHTVKNDFVDNGCYPGKTAWNFKWRILTEGSDPVSLAAGSLYLGAKSYNNQYYGTSPYFVFSKQFRRARLHLGYQTNLLGTKEADDDNKKSRGVIVGLDGVIYDHPNRPATLMIDYTGGPLATWGFGLYQQMGPKWAWTYSFYVPASRTLPLSGDELPRQQWIGVNYFIRLK